MEICKNKNLTNYMKIKKIVFSKTGLLEAEKFEIEPDLYTYLIQRMPALIEINDENEKIYLPRFSELQNVYKIVFYPAFYSDLLRDNFVRGYFIQTCKKQNYIQDEFVIQTKKNFIISGNSEQDIDNLLFYEILKYLKIKIQIYSIDTYSKDFILRLDGNIYYLKNFTSELFYEIELNENDISLKSIPIQFSVKNLNSSQTSIYVVLIYEIF
jgi:hypothetical protein